LPQNFNKLKSINFIISISLICIIPKRPTQNNNPAVWWLGASAPQSEDFLETRFFPEKA